jgi:hypothetical protein
MYCILNNEILFSFKKTRVNHPVHKNEVDALQAWYVEETDLLNEEQRREKFTQ